MQRRKDAELYKTLRLCVLAFENDARDEDFFFDFGKYVGANLR